MFMFVLFSQCIYILYTVYVYRMYTQPAVRAFPVGPYFMTIG